MIFVPLLYYKGAPFARKSPAPGGAGREDSAAEYAACQALACRVSACMEKLRADGGIRFPSDR